MSDENKYRQLAVFSTIVAEVVVSPCACGGLLYWLLRATDWKLVGATLGALAGLAIAFYRISKIRKRFESNES